MPGNIALLLGYFAEVIRRFTCITSHIHPGYAPSDDYCVSCTAVDLEQSFVDVPLAVIVNDEQLGIAVGEELFLGKESRSVDVMLPWREADFS